ncbi:MAG: DUF427 domain-containing protein [Solirubrobacteraceae bacterium]|nr:DUF427 domain-containing protein [Patulibacter sp.]
MSTSTIEPAPGRIIAPNGVVAIEPAEKRVRVVFNGEVIADTTGAIRLIEAGHGPVLYLPLADLEQAFLEPTDTHTTCPRKGEASYYSIVVGDKRSVDAIWTYPENLPDALDISGYVAFYPDRIDRWEELDV